MKTSVEKLENDCVALEVEVDPEQVEEALDVAYRKVVRQINIPGFRKGRAPRSVVESRFGKEVLYEEAIEHLVPLAYEKALEINNLEPIDQPDIDIIEFESGKPFRFKATVQLKPEVELGEYRGVAVTKRIRKVDDHDVDHMLEHLREGQAQLVVAERDTVADGDYVVIDFEGYVDGEPFQGGAAKAYQLQVGSGHFIPGFEDQLIGAKVDEEIDVKVTFPENYHSEDLAGKDAVFKVTVHEIKVRQLPELDDDFAKDVSDKETLAELREQIRENLEKEAEDRADDALRNQVIEAVAAQANVNLPEVLVEREIQVMLDDMRQSLAYQGIPLERYLEATEQTLDQLKEEMRPDAEKRVKASLVIEAVAEAEGIQANAEDIEARIEEMLEGREGTEREEMKQALQREDVQERIASSIRVRKTVDFLVEHAQVTDEFFDAHEADAEDNTAEDETDVDEGKDKAEVNAASE